ncbi:hypothetical protein Gotur_019677 [Gossypium turneri]
MSNEEEYYINLYVGGKFVCDPHVRYSGGDMVRTLQDNLKVVWNDSCNINMLNYWVKHNEIDLYVEHEIAIFADDDIMLAVETVESAGYGNEGVEVAGSKGGEGGEGVEGLGGEDVEVVGNRSGEGGEGGEGVEGFGEEGIEVTGSQYGLENGDEGLNSIVEEAGDEGLKDEIRQKVREVEGRSSRKAKETILDETESESSRKQFEAEVPEKVEVEGLNDRVGREEEGNRAEYFDSDDHGSILGSDDNDNIDTCKRKRRRSRFPTYNPNSTSPHFCIGMLFKDGEQFKSAIRKYSMCCRRELKIIKNEPNKVRVKCITFKKCKWRIFVSYSNMSICIQVKSFHDEYNCCVSFRNRMFNVKVITDHFEATIRDHQKMKLREIQRRVALEMHVNVNMIRCRRAKKIVKDKLKENFIEEFAML